MFVYKFVPAAGSKHLVYSEVSPLFFSIFPVISMGIFQPLRIPQVRTGSHFGDFERSINEPCPVGGSWGLPPSKDELLETWKRMAKIIK